MTIDLTYDFDMAMYNEIADKVHWFANMHPIFIFDPNVNPSMHFNQVIRNPVKHTLGRDGDWMYCIECGEACETGTIPKRPLTPQEYSLSRFD